MAVLDVVVAILLVVAIGFAYVLNRRLAAFRAARSEFEQFIERFNTAAGRAEAGVNALKLSGDATGRALQQSILRAQALRDEIAFLIERAEPMVDRLTAAHRTAADSVRAKPAVPAAARPAARDLPVREAPAPQPAAPANEPDLLKTLSSLR
ncbi:MAG TPA: DUF6468 domain-containing protein [Alphaproteobacteria bacterium]